MLSEIPISLTDNTNVDGRKIPASKRKQWTLSVSALVLSMHVTVQCNTIQYSQMRVLLFDPFIHLVLQAFILWHYTRALATL